MVYKMKKSEGKKKGGREIQTTNIALWSVWIEREGGRVE